MCGPCAVVCVCQYVHSMQRCVHLHMHQLLCGASSSPLFCGICKH